MAVTGWCQSCQRGEQRPDTWRSGAGGGRDRGWRWGHRQGWSGQGWEARLSPDIGGKGNYRHADCSPAARDPSLALGALQVAPYSRHSGPASPLVSWSMGELAGDPRVGRGGGGDHSAHSFSASPQFCLWLCRSVTVALARDPALLRQRGGGTVRLCSARVPQLPCRVTSPAP